MSKRHCSIIESDGTHTIQDHSSTNGTFVNGRLVQRATLSPSDKIILGGTILHFCEHAPESLAHQKSVTVVEDAPADQATYEVSVEDIKAGYSGFITTEGRRVDSRHLMRNLLTIYDVGQTILSSSDTSELLRKILNGIFGVVQADRGYVVLMDEDTGQLKPVASKFREGETSEDTADLSICRSVVRKVLDEEKGILSADALADERFKTSDSIVIQRVRSLLCVPLKGRQRVLGMIYVDSHSDADVFTVDDLRMLTAIGMQAGITLENMTLFEEKRDLIIGSLRSLVALLELRDPYTSGHAERVSAYALAMCDDLGVDPEAQNDLELAGLLHDIGKVVVPDAIINKPGRLTPAEREIVNAHPVQGAAILANIKGIETIAEAVRHHHERYDGNGHPDGVGGDGIPLSARLLAVADAFDAMYSERPYRDALPLEKVLSRLKEEAGGQFDPAVVRAFIRAVEEGAIASIPRVVASAGTVIAEATTEEHTI